MAMRACRCATYNATALPKLYRSVAENKRSLCHEVLFFLFFDDVRVIFHRINRQNVKFMR